jgi:hypothetical protein
MKRHELYQKHVTALMDGSDGTVQGWLYDYCYLIDKYGCLKRYRGAPVLTARGGAIPAATSAAFYERSQNQEAGLLK